jgi:mevalonate kinase
LCGEHAVVYGHPAIAVAVDRSTHVTLRPRPGRTEIRSPHVDHRVREALCTVLPEDGFEVEVETDLPVGRGMGSSAALAVALVRARADLAGENVAAEVVEERALPVERSFHGTPSGVDVAVSAHGGCLWFERGQPPVREHLPCPALPLVVLDTGEQRQTSRMVAAVAARRPGCDADLEAIGALVHEARTCLHDVRTLGALLTENHARLQALGVSTPALDALVELALAHGAAGAKLAGAGGGGVVLALAEDPAPLLRAAAARSVHAFACEVWTP